MIYSFRRRRGFIQSGNFSCVFLGTFENLIQSLVQAAVLASLSVELKRADLLLAAAKTLGLLPPTAAGTDPLHSERVQIVQLSFATSGLKRHLF